MATSMKRNVGSESTGFQESGRMTFLPGKKQSCISFMQEINGGNERI
jgi:hypothetical protein